MLISLSGIICKLIDVALQIPDNINFDQAATVPIGLGTAAVGLYARSWARGGADLIPGWEAAGRAKYTNQPIVVFGGSSSVGQYGQFIAISTCNQLTEYFVP